MAIGNIGIANLALSFLGESPIQSFDEGSATANRVRDCYEGERRSVLRAYSWAFALKVARLATVAETPIDFKYTYTRPADCLRPLRLMREGELSRQSVSPAYLCRGNKILSDLPAAYLEYVSDVADTDMYDSQFIEAFAYKLASVLAASIKGDIEYSKNMYEKYMMVCSEAAAHSKSEAAEDTSDNPYLEARI